MWVPVVAAVEDKPGDHSAVRGQEVDDVGAWKLVESDGTPFAPTGRCE